jgi:RNA polymerase sigma-70 factor (ECF subfamily)
MGRESDAALAVRIASDDLGAEAELCRRFAPRIRLYGLRHLRDEASADDLVQQVLLLMLESLRAGKVREPEHIASYVLGSCRMVALDLRRGEARRRRLLDQFPALEESIREPETPVDIERLRGCVEKLPMRERTVAILSFYSERAADDIGSELAMTPGNVRVVRHRALGHLQKCMGLEETP